MRKSIFRIMSIFLLPLVLLGCSTGTIMVRAKKKFQFSEIEKIHQGMKEEEVIKLLGKPTAVGIDEQNREYLLYQQIGVKQSTVMTPTITIGYAHWSTSMVPTGFEVRIYIKEGIVQSVGYTLYRE